MNRTTLSLALGALVLSACSSAPLEPQRVPSKLLSGLSREAMAPVKIAESDAAVTKKAYSTAKRQTKLADEAVQVVNAELDVLTAKIGQSRTALGEARELNVESTIAATKTRYSSDLEAARTMRLKLALTKRERAVATLREALALEKMLTAKEELQLARAEVIDQTKVAPMDAVPVEDLMSSVLFHRAEVRAAETLLSTARRDLEAARSAFENARSSGGGTGSGSGGGTRGSAGVPVDLTPAAPAAEGDN